MKYNLEIYKDADGNGHIYGKTKKDLLELIHFLMMAIGSNEPVEMDMADEKKITIGAKRNE